VAKFRATASTPTPLPFAIRAHSLSKRRRATAGIGQTRTKSYTGARRSSRGVAFSARGRLTRNEVVSALDCNDVVEHSRITRFRDYAHRFSGRTIRALVSAMTVPMASSRSHAEGGAPSSSDVRAWAAEAERSSPRIVCGYTPTDGPGRRSRGRRGGRAASR